MPQNPPAAAMRLNEHLIEPLAARVEHAVVALLNWKDETPAQERAHWESLREVFGSGLPAGLTLGALSERMHQHPLLQALQKKSASRYADPSHHQKAVALIEFLAPLSSPWDWTDHPVLSAGRERPPLINWIWGEPELALRVYEQRPAVERAQMIGRSWLYGREQLSLASVVANVAGNNKDGSGRVALRWAKLLAADGMGPFDQARHPLHPNSRAKSLAEELFGLDSRGLIPALTLQTLGGKGAGEWARAWEQGNEQRQSVLGALTLMGAADSDAFQRGLRGARELLLSEPQARDALLSGADACDRRGRKERARQMLTAMEAKALSAATPLKLPSAPARAL